jgi:hypothetical protein
MDTESALFLLYYNLSIAFEFPIIILFNIGWEVNRLER